MRIVVVVAARRVAVDADEVATVGNFLDSLAVALNIEQPPTSVWVERTGERLHREWSLGDCDLRHGDTLSLTSISTTRRPILRFGVDAGPDGGALTDLGVGDTVVGRGGESQIKLTDQEVSREHLTITVEGTNGTARLRDMGSSNGTWVDRVRVTDVTVAPGQPFELGDDSRAELLTVGQPSAVRARNGVAIFNRAPRLLAEPRVEPLDVRPPPERSGSNRLPMATAAIPLVGAGVLFGVTGNSTTLLMAGLSPLMAVGSWFESKRSRSGDFKTQSARFVSQLGQALDRVAEQANRHRSWLLSTHPGPAAISAYVRDDDQRLWQRRPADPDFLSVRLGVAEHYVPVDLSLPPGGDQQLRDDAEKVLNDRSRFAAAPVTLSLGQAGGMGVCGPQRQAVMRWIVAQVAANHSPIDVKLLILTGNQAAWQWATWLPHNSDDVPVVPRDLAEARKALSVLKNRPGERNSQRVDPTYVVLLDDPPLLPFAEVADLVEGGVRNGITFVASAALPHQLPGAAKAIVDTERKHLDLEGRSVEIASIETFNSDAGLTLARGLAGLKDAAQAEADAGLPTRLTLPDLLGVDVFEPDAIVSRWQASEPGVSAVLGSAATGPIRLQLSGDTSHALVGGTTGSGKSELLQTLVASIAIEHAPTDVAMVLVDYKGGAAFKDCVDLPHVVGFVTDLDGLLVHRALTSLRAEIHRRERIIKSAHVQSLDEMVTLGLPDRPPYLLLVVDEFATLAKELPAFVEGVLDIAQRGRSLGVHLVLATQRPAGSINDAIRTNVPVRIALRLNDDADSDDVIDSPVAARIRRGLPGRGFIRRSHTELEEFQAAYVGATTREAGGVAHVAITLLDNATAGEQVTAPSRSTPVAASAGSTTKVAYDLRRIVDAVAAATLIVGDAPPVRPWLPPLPAVLKLVDLAPAPDGSALLGLLDEPEQQRQSPLLFDLERDGSLLVVGAPGSGKTTVLRTAAVSLSATHSVEQLWLYGLDFGTGGLSTIADLPHTGSVIPGTDIERVERLLDWLRAQVDARQRQFATTGAATLSEYQRSGGTDAPRIVVLLDNLAGFRAAFDDVENGRLVGDLPRLITDGRATGVHVIVTADRRGTITSPLLQVLGARVILRLSDPDEYGLLGLDARLAPQAKLVAGAGFVGGTRLAQIAVAGTETQGDAQSRAVSAHGTALHAIALHAATAAVSTVPTRIDRLESMVRRASVATAMPSQSALASNLGVSGLTLGSAWSEAADGHLLIAGPVRSGRSTALRAWCDGAQGDIAGRWLFAPRRSSATNARWDRVVGRADLDEAATELDELIKATSTGIWLVGVDDADELSDSRTDEVLAALARWSRDGQAWFACASEVTPARRGFRGLMSEIKRERHVLLLDPDPTTDGDLAGVRLPRRTSQVPSPPGRGYLCRSGRVEPIQIYVD